jgi:hypothetical protein
VRNLDIASDTKIQWILELRMCASGTWFQVVLHPSTIQQGDTSNINIAFKQIFKFWETGELLWLCPQLDSWSHHCLVSKIILRIIIIIIRELVDCYIISKSPDFILYRNLKWKCHNSKDFFFSTFAYFSDDVPSKVSETKYDYIDYITNLQIVANTAY